MPAAKGETLVGIPWSWYNPIREKADKMGEPVKAVMHRIIRAGAESEGVEITGDNPPVGWPRGKRSEGPK